VETWSCLGPEPPSNRFHNMFTTKPARQRRTESVHSRTHLWLRISATRSTTKLHGTQCAQRRDPCWAVGGTAPKAQPLGGLRHSMWSQSILDMTLSLCLKRWITDEVRNHMSMVKERRASRTFRCGGDKEGFDRTSAPDRAYIHGIRYQSRS
jgi:hypothetical protein